MDRSLNLAEIANVNLQTHWLRANGRGGVSAVEKSGWFGRLVMWLTGDKVSGELPEVANRIGKMVLQLPQGEQKETLPLLKDKLRELEGKVSQHTNLFNSCMGVIGEKEKAIEPPVQSERRGRSVSPPPRNRKKSKMRPAESAPARMEEKTIRRERVDTLLNNRQLKPLLTTSPLEAKLFDVAGYSPGRHEGKAIALHVQELVLSGDLKDVPTAELDEVVMLAIIEARLAGAGVPEKKIDLFVQLFGVARDIERRGDQLSTPALRELYAEVTASIMESLSAQIGDVLNGELDVDRFQREVLTVCERLASDPEELWMARYGKECDWVADQTTDSHKVLGEGICLAVTTDAAAYLAQYPDVSAEDLHRHLSGKAGETGNPTAIFRSKHRKMQAYLGMETDGAMQLPQAVKQKLGVDQTSTRWRGMSKGGESIALTIEAAQEKGKNGSFVVGMADDDGGHVFNSQVSHETGVYGFMDTNFGMWQFDDYASYRKAFVSFVDAIYSEEYPMYAVSHFKLVGQSSSAAAA